MQDSEINTAVEGWQSGISKKLLLLAQRAGPESGDLSVTLHFDDGSSHDLLGKITVGLDFVAIQRRPDSDGAQEEVFPLSAIQRIVAYKRVKSLRQQLEDLEAALS